MKEKNFWKSRNVLITGINGFVGSNLAKILIKRKAKVYGLIRNLDKTSMLFFENLDKKITLINGKLTNKDLLKRIINEENIQSIFHLAAQVEVGVARENPMSTWETNIRGTYNLLEAIRENSKKIDSIVIASSDKAYGDYPKSQLPYKENYALKPKYFYDTSKACADLIAKSYTESEKKLPIIITRFANIYRPGQLNFSALIPDCIRSSLGYSSFEPRSNGTDERDFLYVEDVTKLYLIISEALSKNKKLIGEIFNAGTEKSYQVKEIIKNIYTLNKGQKKLNKIYKMFNKKKTLSEIKYQLMDFEKVYNFFSWKPTTSMNKGLNITNSWYKKYLKKIN